ncbi:MAG: GerMN domain-containing protein [Anaerolineales bacterium]
MTRRSLLLILLLPWLIGLACGPTPPPTPPAAATPTNTLAPPSPPPTLLPTTTPPPTATHTSVPTITPSPTPTPIPIMTITVYFTDHNRYLAATPPFEVAVTRQVPQTSAIATAVLNAFFAGPTAEEHALGLRLITSGATGFSSLSIHDGVAHVHLTGECNSEGATYTIASPLYVNLTQFSTVSYVKIYDQNGHTQQPTGQSNSIPACLEP